MISTAPHVTLLVTLKHEGRIFCGSLTLLKHKGTDQNAPMFVHYQCYGESICLARGHIPASTGIKLLKPVDPKSDTLTTKLPCLPFEGMRHNDSNI